MTAFVLPISDGKPLEIVDFKVDLLSSPPEIKEKIINAVDNYISTQTDAIKIIYNDAPIDEGRLNIYVCKFKTGKYRLHIFGKIKGQEFRTEKELSEAYSNSLSILNDRIKYVLISSRNILRNYYLSNNVKSIEDHLLAFLIPS
jgi:hypothetical protein